jgi:putative tryptophan/tyrosine transport system substrate-binding protein
MRRRQFITLLGGAAILPAAASAQSMPVMGYISQGSSADALYIAPLRRGLAEAGYVEGRNLTIEYRWGEGHAERTPALAADLVQRRVAVIMVSGSAGDAKAVLAATKTIPVVFANGADPVQTGLVSSMNRPGGNATGVSFYTGALVAKRLELLRELVPNAGKIAFLVDPTNPVTEMGIAEMQAAARNTGQDINIVKASTPQEIDAAFADVTRQGGGGLLVNVGAFFNTQRRQIVELAARYRIPGSYNNRDYVATGGLTSYGPDLSDSNRQAGVYLGRILHGEKAGDLPVLQPTKFELAINLRTAKALALMVPESFLLRADEVIE